MLKAGLIGCGKISAKHVAVLERLRKENLMTLEAVADVSEDRLAPFKKSGVKTFRDFNEMLPHVDLAIIATPSGTHAPLGLAVAARKVHVVVEKPLALSLGDADRLVEVCEKNAVGLFEIKQNRFNRSVVKAKEAIVSGRLGKIITAAARVLWSRTQEYYNSAEWRGTWAMDGGVFANQAIHHLDLLIWFLGPVESVMAKGDTLMMDIETEDTGIALLKFSSGALVTLQATVCVRPRDIEGAIDLCGVGGTIRLAGFSADKIALWEMAKPLPEDDEIRSHWASNPSGDPVYTHYECLKNIAASIQQKRPGLIDGLEARKTLEVLSAIYESMETGHEVTIGNRASPSRLGKADG